MTSHRLLLLAVLLSCSALTHTMDHHRTWRSWFYPKPGTSSLSGVPSKYPLPKSPSKYSIPKSPSKYSIPKSPSKHSIPKSPSKYPIPKSASKYYAPKPPSKYSIPKSPSKYLMPKSPPKYYIDLLKPSSEYSIQKLPLVPAPQTPPNVPAPQTPPKVPAPQTPPKVPAPQTPPKVPAPQTPPKVPAPQTPPKVPAPQTPKSIQLNNSYQGDCYNTNCRKQFIVESGFKGNWFQAFEFCARRGKRMAMVTSKEEEDLLLEAVAKAGSPPGLWLGATDFGHPGYFVWFATGQPVTYSDFATGEPNHPNQFEPCLALIKSSSSWGRPFPRATYQWYNVVCRVPRYIVCEQCIGVGRHSGNNDGNQDNNDGTPNNTDEIDNTEDNNIEPGIIPKEWIKSEANDAVELEH